MLFAACTPAAPKPLQLTAHVANNLGQQQLTSLQQLKDQHAMSLSSSSSSSAMQTPAQMSPQHQIAATGNAAAAVAVAAAARANEEAKEAMRKLDATLVAYLAGETKLQSKQLEPELDLELDLNSSNESNIVDTDDYVLEEFSDPIVETVENITREELQLFRRIKSIKLQLEALTLEPEGTKLMELLQNDTRPIFTVECQLSHELIQQLPRYEMFHIMQFESEKFHSLTQCTRFGQEAQRDINLTPLIDELDNTLNGNGNGGDAPNFGRIHFTVWWREPGTCLNEMLGMGVFELRELYDAALLEQCKRITIQRRGVPLANIYLKINLLLCSLADTNNNNAADLSCEAALHAMKQHAGGSNKNKKGGNGGGSGKSTTNASSAAANSANTSNTTAKEDNTKDNNEEKASTSSGFNDDTLQIRLLTGLISATEVRYFEMPLNREFHLVCERFWRSESATAKSIGAEQFYYQEQFSVLRDTNFVNRVKRDNLRLLIYQRLLDTTYDDGNGNSDEELEPLGLVILPLQPFFIAYNNDVVANRLILEKLPVISVDAWTPIFGENGQALGEIKCLLAIGSEEQISNLKNERDIKPLHSDLFNSVAANRGNATLYKTIRMPSEECRHAIGQPDKKKSIRATVQVMEMLHAALQQTNMARGSTANPNPLPTTTKPTQIGETTPIGLEKVPAMPFEPSTSATAGLEKPTPTTCTTDTAPAGLEKPTPTTCTTDTAPAGLEKPTPTTCTTDTAPAGLEKPTPTTCTTDAAPADPVQSRKKSELIFQLTIKCAVGLPLNPGERCKPGSNSPVSTASKLFPPGEAPSTYVTFQAKDCVGMNANYKSHEGNVYATSVVMRSVLPRWNETFIITVDNDYLYKPKQNFVLKLWKKANVPPATECDTNSITKMVPTPNEDVIVGFTSLDLSIFLNGLQYGGVYFMLDFNGRMAARLELSAKATEKWYMEYLAEKMGDDKQQPKPVGRMPPAAAAAAAASTASTDRKATKEIIEFGKSHDISHLNLNEAVNHKYNELKVISDRLRTRLVDVTGESLPEVFNLDDLNNWQPLNEVIDGDIEMDIELNEFERDINDPSAATNDVDTNKSDNKNKKLISKTGSGAADPTIE